MPRPSLSNVSLSSLQAEIARRASKFQALLKLRDDVDRQIKELQPLAGVTVPLAQAVQAEPAPARRRKRVSKRRGRKALPDWMQTAVAAAPAKAGKRRSRRGGFGVTGEEFIVGLLQAKPMTTAELSAAWKKAGRSSPVDNELSRLGKVGKITRTKQNVGRGSIFSVAGAPAQAARRGRPPGVKVAAGRKTRRVFAQTASEFVLGQLKGKTLSTGQLKAAWNNAGRGGMVDSELSNLFKAGKITREKLGGKLGSNYSLA